MTLHHRAETAHLPLQQNRLIFATCSTVILKVLLLPCWILPNSWILSAEVN